MSTLRQMIIGQTLRVPRVDSSGGDGSIVARQMDAVLAGVGFTAAQDLLSHVSGQEPGAAMDLAVEIIGAVREQVGDAVEHNVYFKDFPHNVPDTMDFWVSCLRDLVIPDDATDTPVSDDDLIAALEAGVINLLQLPNYGRYQHTYAELVASRDEFIASAKDRVTVLRLGDSLDDEIGALYRTLAGSPTPLGEARLELLAELAPHCLALSDTVEMPGRENRAVVNAARMAAGLPLIAVDSVADVLRVACRISGGDVTLVTSTRFRSLRRPERRALLAALDQVVAGNEGKLGDVSRHAGPFKRLGELLHPHEHPRFPHAAEVFAVARGQRTVRSLAGRAELAFAEGDRAAAARILAVAPGMFVRSLDRLLRLADSAEEIDAVVGTTESVLPSVSGRVLCSVREHLVNRAGPDPARVFANRSRRAWATEDKRAPLPADVIERATTLIDAELAGRLPAYDRLVVDPAVLDVALPLSGKASEDGFAVLPRGSRTRVDGEVLRFFTYWRQELERTDYDLSVLMLDDEFRSVGHVSWTNTQHGGVTYSGDLTAAPDGATEFIDVTLDTVEAAYVVPQVNIYAGEGFHEVAESMFGWMTREHAQQGMPFDARTVRARSEMRGSGRVALPILFGRDADGWYATWMHLYLAGWPNFNAVESNRASTTHLVHGVAERTYLTIGYLVDLLRAKAGSVTRWEPGIELAEPVTFIGMSEPDGLPDGSTTITLDRLNQLIPR